MIKKPSFEVVRVLVGTFILCSLPSQAQVVEVAELSVRDIDALDRDKTVVILRGGIIEEHGPYLPSFSDGYLSTFLADRVAEAIASETGRPVLMFPIIPLGTGLPSDFGGREPLSGSFAVRPETLRTVYMDMAATIGDKGFKTIFVSNTHGAPTHNRALLQAAEYFNDHYDGEMVILTAVVYSKEGNSSPALTPEQVAEQGLGVHAEATESAENMALVPHLVHPDIKEAPPQTPVTGDDLSRLAAAPEWPGYFGSPRHATPEMGQAYLKWREENIVDLALKILDGLNWRELPTRADTAQLPDAFSILDQNTNKRANAEKRRQTDWLKSQGLNEPPDCRESSDQSR